MLVCCLQRKVTELNKTDKIISAGDASEQKPRGYLTPAQIARRLDNAARRDQGLPPRQYPKTGRGRMWRPQKLPLSVIRARRENAQAESVKRADDGKGLPRYFPFESCPGQKNNRLKKSR